MHVAQPRSIGPAGRRALLSILLATVFAAAFAVVPVAGDAGNVGEHTIPVYCWGGPGDVRMLAVGAPDVKSSSVADHPTLMLIGGQHPQWVYFRAHLFYSPDQLTWQWAASGPWFVAQVGDSLNSMYQEIWWDYDTQQDERPEVANTWPINWRGYYRVAAEFYWAADEYTGDLGSGYAYGWATTHEDFNSANSYADSCSGAS
jgi:hypothetical protein